MSAAPQLNIQASRLFVPWLAEQGASLAFTTYQAGKLFLIGLKPNGQLSVFERTFNRCMGLWASSQTLYMSSLYQIWRLENMLTPGETHEGYDRLYVPQVGYTTGDVDAHDLALDTEGKVVFINTLFSCLATVSERYSFVPLWQPPFVSRLAPEDRCHLNGLAVDEQGSPSYVTCVARSDVNEGWRDHRKDGGLVLDVSTGETVCAGLSMPHSPRLYRGRLWLLSSGTGELGYVDPKAGRFEPVAFCPGYLRGLSFIGDYAVVGLSRPREKQGTFTGLPLDDRLAEKGAVARCALQVVDLRRGEVPHEVRIEGVVQELYDVCVLPGVQRPMAIGFRTDEIRRVLSIEPQNHSVVDRP